MAAPGKKPEPKLREMRGLKTLVTIMAVALVYIWASTSLQITPGDLVDKNTWKAMGDLTIRLGPYYRVTSCKDAQTAWGDDDPIDKPNPKKVKAVCEEGRTQYLLYDEFFDRQKEFLKTIKDPLLDTLRMAILGATIGALLAVPFSLLAARNLVKNKAVYYTVRTVLNLIRTVPDLVWAALLTGALGLGALPGVVALTVFSFGLNAKLLSESVETIDPGPLEAMQACGANKLQQIRYGVVPQVLPQFLAYGIYVLEIDVRASTVLGLVGAGGIGVLLNTELTFGRFYNVGVVILAMLVVVVAMDFVSTKVRERLI